MEQKRTGKTILVTGITGSQGGAAARRLLQQGWRVRGLTRNTGSPAAGAIAALGVELIQGNMGDRASLDQALKGAHGVYAVTDFFRNGIAGEIRQGKLIADAAKAAGITHFVYSSVISADRKTHVPHFESKYLIESHIAEIGLPATILRPGVFMEDLTDKKYVPPANWGMIAKLSGVGTRIKWIAIEDIGAIAARVFSEPDRYIGKTIPLAGDEKSIQEAREIFKKVKGKYPFQFTMPTWLFRRLVSSDLVEMWLWFRRGDFDADIAATRELHPGLMDMETWLTGRSPGH